MSTKHTHTKRIGHVSTKQINEIMLNYAVNQYRCGLSVELYIIWCCWMFMFIYLECIQTPRISAGVWLKTIFFFISVGWFQAGILYCWCCCDQFYCFSLFLFGFDWPRSRSRWLLRYRNRVSVSMCCMLKNEWIMRLSHSINHSNVNALAKCCVAVYLSSFYLLARSFAFTLSFYFDI